MLVAVAALVALALGGAVFAQAQSSRSPAHETASLPDQDHVQSGDQTTPDTATATATASGRYQSGDQSTADTGSASETPGAENPETGTGPESVPSSESAPTNDGSGGHADEPGSPNADHQFQGNE
jgi:hypothetical protein